MKKYISEKLDSEKILDMLQVGVFIFFAGLSAVTILMTIAYFVFVPLLNHLAGLIIGGL